MTTERQYRSDRHREQAEKAMERWEPYLYDMMVYSLDWGWSQRTIAQHYGVSQTTIHRVLKRAGIEARPVGRKKA